ncbi:DNA-directed RNA polymerases I, II, and III subunit RPABC1-like [Scaptodrosophila lebanonensis]|uniref:DNA-directed RNA polymerases I, II, and III subunit RPABC1 n=1 Tax=Drosophila lebanonensis TaxID=7225 RepID=A0A6J2T8H5_DROLE|nr:DNA-directed RNA polymerases I, II, and III subunit RPABC1-like [Scaptodrosophila lebanonensis]
MSKFLFTDKVVTQNLWRIRKTMAQMVHDRGYLVSSNEKDQTLEEFSAEFGRYPVSEKKPLRSDLTMMVAHIDDPKDVILVYFSDDIKVGIKTIRDCVTRMNTADIFHAILIIRSRMTPTARMSLQELPRYRMEYFTERELMYNITEHEMVPKHIALTEAEKSELLAHYKVKMSQLMRITTTDVVARYYGLKKGQVVKIIRSSETAGRYISYRAVV